MTLQAGNYMLEYTLRNTAVHSDILQLFKTLQTVKERAVQFDAEFLNCFREVGWVLRLELGILWVSGPR